MAQNGSPPGSPTMPAYGRKPRSRSATPTAAPSKRDKRRAMLSERLNDMIAAFDGNYVDHYVAQLSAIQCDINLIMRADPYKNAPLEDSPDAINRLVEDARRETRSRQFSGESEETFDALKGKYYSQFVDEVNTAMERRDADLTVAHNQYEAGIEELHKVHRFRKTLAHEEHQLLSKTIRDRLIQSVTQKKARLLRDKEQLDIADSNALLLNPNQFSIGNPASPGGPQNGRKTRHTRLRPVDGEEVGAAAQENNKRKRKAALEENDQESPAPLARLIDNRISTPYRDARAKVIHTQYEAPVFSIERLFTEKELALNLNKAHMVTSELLMRSQMQANGSVGTARSVDQEMVEPAVAAASTGEVADGAEVDAQTADASMLLNLFPHPSAAASGHATRSTQRTTANPLSDLASVATAVAPFPPVQISTASGKSGPPHAPSWPALSDAEIQNDLAMMRLDPSDPLIVKLTERCCEKQGGFINPEQWRVAAGGDGEDQMRAAVGDPVMFGLEMNSAPISMMRQTSGMGMGYGGVAMSRNTSMMSDGGMGGGINTADFGMRTRGRV